MIDSTAVAVFVEDFGAARSKSAVLTRIADRKGPASMDADLDLLLTTVYVTADDLLAERQNNAAPSVMTRRVVTLCVAQAIMGIPSDPGVLGGRGPSAWAPVSAAVQAARLLQTAAQAGGHGGVVDGRLR
jgi:hypothetical protein